MTGIDDFKLQVMIWILMWFIALEFPTSTSLSQGIEIYLFTLIFSWPTVSAKKKKKVVESHIEEALSPAEVGYDPATC